MKAKAKTKWQKKPANGGKRAVQAAELTPEQKKRREESAEWDRLTKFPNYYAKMKELRLADPKPDELHRRAVTALHALMAQEMWFSQNTPYPYKVSHRSEIAGLAGLACCYLRTLALSDNQGAIEKLAKITVEMTETLTALLNDKTLPAKRNAKLIHDLKRKFGPHCSVEFAVKSNLELFQPLAHELPYWPVLYFKNTAANNHLPLTIDQLELGKDCPINVSESAKFSLQTPLNALLWHCLRHFQSVHSSIRGEFEGPGFGQVTGSSKTFEEAIARMVFEKGELPLAINPFMIGMVRRDEIPIYKKSFNLPPLTKDGDSSIQWADLAIVPFVKARFPKRIPTGKSGRPRFGDFRKQVIQQLRQIARKGGHHDIG